MAITFAQTGVNFTANTTTIAQAFGSNTSIGSILFAMLWESGAASAATPSDTIGNTWNLISNNGNLAWWWATNKAGGANTVTMTHTSDTMKGLQILEYTVTGGINPSLFLNTSAVQSSTTSLSVGPLTPRTTSDTLIAVFFPTTTAETFTNTWSGSNARQTSTVGVVDKTGVGGAQTATMTASNGGTTFLNVLLVFTQIVSGTGGSGGGAAIWLPNPLTNSVNF